MKYVKNPIFLLVNPNLNIGEKMSIQAFQSRSIGIPDGTMGTMFLSLEVNLEFFDTERCAVDMMVADSLNKDNQLSEVSSCLPSPKAFILLKPFLSAYLLPYNYLFNLFRCN